jgi:hypothetical protein
MPWRRWRLTAMTDVQKPAEEMTREELLDLVLNRAEEGIRITFSGKDVARKIGRKVQPRTSRRIAKYSVGSEEEQARNQVIEGENLQAMVTLHRDRGQVDLILTDPPYNTGRDFRYNDRWDEDPNDPDLGELVAEDDRARHTKWMRFMWPRLKVMHDMLKPSGVLAICVDGRELFRLGEMLDEPELFGQDNRLAIINWQKSASAQRLAARLNGHRVRARLRERQGSGKDGTTRSSARARRWIQEQGRRSERIVARCRTMGPESVDPHGDGLRRAKPVYGRAALSPW